MKRFYFITLLVFCFCNSLRAQSMRDTLSREDKLYTLSKIWKEADYNFVFFDKVPKLNWDSLYIAYIPKILATRNVYQYFKVLSSFMANLKDGHTGVQVNQNYWNQIDSPPITIVRHGNTRYVTAIDESLKDQVPIGSEIVQINGKSWPEFFASADLENNEWTGFQNSELELTLLTPDKRTLKAVVKRNSNVLFRNKTMKMIPGGVPVVTKNFEYKSLSPQIAYVGINTFADSVIVKNFNDALPEIRKHQTLILDIRQNGGGNDAYAIEVAKYITDKPYMIGPMWSARNNNSAQKAWAVFYHTPKAEYEKTTWDRHPGDTVNIPKDLKPLNMPVYILTSQRTGSAAEDFLIYLNGSKNITTIGQTTNGSSGQPLTFTIPGNFSVRICAKRDAFPDGTDFIGVGIKPNVYVEPFFSLTGEEKKDLELNKALEIIASNKR